MSGVSTAVRSSISFLGKNFKQAKAQTPDQVGYYGEKDLAAAKVGQLTTRTDNDTGTLTMVTGHGITTGAILDVYWDGGYRANMVVGTVATNSVPIDGGSGDNLPTNLTAITAMVPSVETVVIVGNNLNNLVADVTDKTVRGLVTYTDGSDVVQAALEIDPLIGAYLWESTSGVTNPLSGATTAKIKYSHASSVGTKKVRAGALRS
jgi:hypothetical protein